MNRWMSGHAAVLGAAVMSAVLIGTLAVGGTAGAAASGSHPPRGYKFDAAAPVAYSEQLPKSDGASTSIKVFSWNIPATSYVLMPEYSCPSATPYFKSNGVEHKDTNIYQAYEADLRVEASDGVGYKAGLHDLKLKTVNVRVKPGDADTQNPRVLPRYTDVVTATGFEKGTWASNSIWARCSRVGRSR